MDNITDKLDQMEYRVRSLRQAYEMFPDISEKSTRWSKYFCSSKVNSIATQVDFRHSCGCCPDAVLYAMPFVNVGDICIYSDPIQIPIGEKRYEGGYTLFANWKTEFKNLQVQDCIIDLCEKYVEKENKSVFDEE